VLRGDDPVPPSVQVVAEVIGRTAALHLAGALPEIPGKPWKGHTYVPAPSRLLPDHVLVDILGWSDALRMCRMFGGEVLQMSKCRGLERTARNRRIWELRESGYGPTRIGDVLDVSPEVVKKVLMAGRDGGAGNPAMARKGRGYNDVGD